jgi:transmembrane sensor
MSESSAKQINAQAAAWIARSLHENWNEAECRARDEWLAQSPSHQIAYWRLESAWSQTNRLTALRGAAPQDAAPPATRMRASVFKAVAAIMLFAALGGLGQRYYAKGTNTAATYSTALGERKLLTLADGTEIELNTNTEIKASVIGAERRIRIEKGEAYFHVKHDPAHPFVVIAAGQKIVDIGTEFVVRRMPGALRVAVLEGRVGLGNAKGRASEELESGDVATARNDSISVTHRPLSDIVTGLSWRHGKLVFHHTPLVEAADEFNRYNREKLVVADAAAGEITINGTFSTADIHAFARLAHAVLGLRVSESGGTIVIAPKAHSN